MINFDAIADAMKGFKDGRPFDHCVVPNFFEREYAVALSQEFLDYESAKWFYYKNPIEDKKALNDWNVFPKKTYAAFSALNEAPMLDLLSAAVGVPLFADPGLHGGGWHMHAAGGNLNPHLDYSIHPKLGLERRLNIIIYLSEELNPSQHGGHLGLWEHDEERKRPGQLVKEIAPLFNSAVIFDTTQNSWHGMSRALVQPVGIYRKSMAVYYLCEPAKGASERGRALFAPRPEQEGDSQVEDIIKLRSDVAASAKVYRTDKQ